MNERIPSVGIWGVGAYLPPIVRKNDWWPEEIVEQWREKAARNLVRPDRDEDDPDNTEGVRRALEAMSAFKDDPFKGAVERRVMPDTMFSSEMEVAAGRDAIERAGIDKSEIGLLLTYGHVPDHLIVPNAPKVHAELGLNRRCLTLGTEAGCNSFVLQLALAEQMIKGGQVRYALLIQHSAVLQMCKPEDHHSVWFGDGATAVVLGPVSEGRGILGRSHGTDGTLYNALLGGQPGKRWHRAAEPPMLFVEDKRQARKMLLMIAELAKQSVDEALAEAGHLPGDVDFYATHQSTRWFADVTKEYIGLHKAKTFDTFTWTGSLGACNIPWMLAMGEREGVLRDDHLVAMHTGGSGITWSGIVMRWGR